MLLTLLDGASDIVIEFYVRSLLRMSTFIHQFVSLLINTYNTFHSLSSIYEKTPIVVLRMMVESAYLLFKHILIHALF